MLGETRGSNVGMWDGVSCEPLRSLVLGVFLMSKGNNIVHNFPHCDSIDR